MRYASREQLERKECESERTSSDLRDGEGDAQEKKRRGCKGWHAVLYLDHSELVWQKSEVGCVVGRRTNGCEKK